MSYQHGGILGVTTHTYRQGDVPGTGYDDFGNLTYLKTLTDDTKNGVTWTSETRSTYYNNGTNGRLKRADVTHTSTAPEASIPVTKVSSFEYYNTGQLKAETVEDAAQNGGTAEKTQYLRTAYTYDVYGNETSVEHKGFKHTGQLEIRKVTKTTDYIAANAHGQPVKRVTTSNALNQTEVAEYHLNLGKQIYHRDSNGLVTTWAFDEFGEHAVETRHDGNQSKVVEHRFATAGEASALPGAFSVLVTETTGEPRATTFYNYDGQVRRSVSGALDPARRVYVDSEYDGLGRMVRQSRPYFDNQNPSHFATTIYQDMTTRPWRATSDDGTAVDYRYGDTWTSRSIVGRGRVQTTYSWFNGLAFEQREGTSNHYTIVKKRYDAAQRLIATIDDKGNRTSINYDRRDRKIRQDDPDMGIWQYGYNSFGELAYQKDAKGQETINVHDVLGRLRRVANASGITEYSFDYRLKGKGKLAKVSYSKAGQPAHYAQHIFYNQSHGRAEQINTCVGAGQALDCSNASLYKQVHKYDALGRLEYIRYPANQWLRHHYQQGRLKRLTLGSKTLWELEEQDASGQTRQVTHGNGLNTEYIYSAQQRLDKIAVLNGTTPTVLHSYSYQPADGLLARRTDHNLDTTETYTYDGHARLKTVKKDYGALSDTITYNYDSLGNLISKPDLASLQNVAIEYGTGTAGPHAVSGVGARDFSYDANGNLLDNGEQQVSWTAFNKPASITRGAHTTGFVYGPGNTRLQRIDGTNTTTYIGLYGGAGPFFEQTKDTATGAIENRWYYRACGQVITIGKQSGTTRNLFYPHTDRLGSTVALTNAAAQVVERYSYDSWGKRRLLDSTEANAPFAASVLRRGFTAHEMLDEVGLVHMNGRIYDPSLGRFLSADPLVQFVSLPSSYNRYSYVLNNPLNAIDPSGYSLKELGHKFAARYQKDKQLRMFITAVSVIATIATGGAAAGGHIALEQAILLAMANGAAASFCH